MATKKRKITQFECSCIDKHENENGCKEIRAEREHLDISRKIVYDSSFVSVLCGTEKKPLYVYRDLLTLHSQHCRQILDEMPDITECKIVLPTITASQFGAYIGWMHTRQLSACFYKDPVDDNECEVLWNLGHILKDDRFQNWCMDALRKCAKKTWADDNVLNWPMASEAKLIYDMTSEESLLRRFVADVLGCNNPFRDDNEGHEGWINLLRSVPELSVDIHIAAAKEWNGTKPWDDEHRASYMVPSVCLSDRWDKLILAKRTRANIKIAADGGCMMSKIELAHLDRN